VAINLYTFIKKLSVPLQNMILLTLLLFLTAIQPPDTPPAAIPVHENMALIPGGTFQMGDVMGDQIQTDEAVHTVTVDTFYLSRTEVTFEEYDAFCSATGREKTSDYDWGRGRRPVIDVDWYDAVEYCNWLSAQETCRRYTPSTKRGMTLTTKTAAIRKNGSSRPTGAPKATACPPRPNGNTRPAKAAKKCASAMAAM